MSPVTIQQGFAVALNHHRAGRLTEAEDIYRKILAADSTHLDAMYHLGLIARQRGKPREAASIWRQIAASRPDRPDLLLQLAWALLDDGEPFEAASYAAQALAVSPDFAEAHSILGRSLAATGKYAEAIESARRATTLRPGSPEPLHHLGLVLHAAGRLVEAESCFSRAIELSPNHAPYHRSLAAVRDSMDDVDGSIAAAEQAMRLAAPDPQILANLSSLQRRRRDYAAALDAAERAVALDPALPAAHGAKAIALLSLGDYRRGFFEYEWRWRCDNFTTRARDFGRPMWDGSDPAGRTILVHTEQGFGDTIQFARYIPLLAARGATVLLECHPNLRPLLKRLNGVARVVPSGMRPPDFDLHAPLLSMPKWFGTTLPTLPREVPYLSADPASVMAWRERVGHDGLKVGLVWSGNVLPDPLRTCELSNFAPLAGIDGVRLYSLQVGAAAEQARAAPAGLSLIDLSKDLRDFAETAAAMQCLDLIVTIDTAAAHLAGALGREVWTLLPWAPDWRWMLDRDDSPWYPTMRLFRQQRKGDWDEPLARVAEELRRQAHTQPTAG